MVRLAFVGHGVKYVGHGVVVHCVVIQDVPVCVQLLEQRGVVSFAAFCDVRAYSDLEVFLC